MVMKLAKRNGQATKAVSRTDIAELAIAGVKQRDQNIRMIEIHLEKAETIVKRLRIAGMINKAGSDEIINELIGSMALLETLL